MKPPAARTTGSPAEHERPIAALPTSRWQRWWPYALLALVTFYCHWLILTNDGPIWDGWFWQYWLKEKRWAPMIDYTSAQALPYTLWAFAPFAFVPHMIPAAMGASFLCLLLEGVLLFVLAQRLARLPRGEALSLAVLAQAIPLFSAAQDFPVFGLIVFRTLFLSAVLCVTLALGSTGPRHCLLRAAALVGFYFSCITNGALLVFYGAAWLLFLFYYRHANGLEILPAARRFALRYPDLLLMPPAVYSARVILLPQFGWYETYNRPGTNLPFLDQALWSFFENVVPYHLAATGKWIVAHPIAVLLLAGAVACWWFRAPQSWALHRGPYRTAQWLGFGAVSLFLAVLPLALAGKFFDAQPVGEASRHCMLAGLPIAVLAFAILRCGFFWKSAAASRGLPAIVVALVVVTGSQYWPVYRSERVETIYSQSALRNFAQEDEIRRSSIVLTSGVSAVKQRIYAITSVAGALGDRTRLVSPLAPRHKIGYLPADTEFHALCTTVQPNEFNRIDPGGQQTIVEIQRQPGSLSDAGLIWRDLQTRWFGVNEERDRFLAGLTALKTKILRPAKPMEPATPPTVVAPGATGRDAPAPFINSLGMSLLPIPGKIWVAQFETTQGQFEKVMAQNPSLFRDPWRPVECVTWHEADEFCRRLNAIEAGRLPTGFKYRLPTAEEFDRLVGDAWVRPAVIVGQLVTWRTAGVGTRPANQFGLHDTVGNVWEWCLDWWEEGQHQKVSKGGSFSNEPDQLEPDAWRYQERIPDPSQRLWILPVVNDRLLGRVRRDSPDQGFWNRGFRVVVAPPAPDPLPPRRLRER